MKITVLGASGFIGSHLVNHLAESSVEVYAPARGERDLSGRSLGHVVYCIGVTSDFRRRVFDTVQAHVCYLLYALEQFKFDSFLYLSSTRVYQGNISTEEVSTLNVNPTQKGDVYNLSKLMGEALCLSIDNQSVRIVRLSNVYGQDFHSSNFFSSVLQDAIDKHTLMLQSSLDSEKDYIYIGDVVSILPQIVLQGKKRIYNIASGRNISHRALINQLRRRIELTVSVAKDAKVVQFPPISIRRIQQEFHFIPTKLEKVIDQLIYSYQHQKGNHDKNRSST
jgi:nucleoside-diphosphate-sugar epimerase